MKILFITRKYPPIIGGMEQFSHGLITEFEKSKNKISKITLGKRQYWLPFFIPYALTKALILSKKNNFDIVHFCDGLWAPFAYWFKKISGKKVSITVHGLDLTWDRFAFYQKMIRKYLPKLDRVYCVSEQTRTEAIKRGASKSKTMFIPNGLDINSFKKRGKREHIRNEIAIQFGFSAETKILLTVGRLRKRKGHAWFINNCYEKIKGEFVYIIVGEGNYRQEIEDAVIKHHATNVFLLGRVDDNTLINLYEAADLFLMPNIKVKGDMEGFGIVAIESSAYGLPVVAARLEGIKDAVHQGKNGVLVEPKNAIKYSEAINKLLKNEKQRKELSKKAELLIKRKFTWSKIREAYEKDIKKVLL